MESTCTKESNSIAKLDDTKSAPPTHPTKDTCFFSHRIFLVLKLSGVESAAFTRPTPWTQRSFSVFVCHVRRFFANHFLISLWKYHWLVVIKPTPLKNMSSSVGMMTFPYIYIYVYIWKNKSHVPKRNPSSKSCNAAVGRWPIWPRNGWYVALLCAVHQPPAEARKFFDFVEECSKRELGMSPHRK